MFTILRFLFTGQCGNLGCGLETFRMIGGEPITIFVPEAGCPVHDPEAWYHVILSDLVKAVRDFCQTMMDGIPVTYDEDVKEALRGDRKV